MIDIIPAIDIIDGKCVRLSQGDFITKKIYNEDPVDCAKRFEDTGIKRLHIVDLDGAKAGSIKNIHSLYQIASATNMIIDYGGGVKTDEDVKNVLDNGAAMINIGSIAITDPQRVLKWVSEYGPHSLLLGADVKDKNIMINGWQDRTDVNILNLIGQYQAAGISQVFCTDISKDGMMQGSATELYRYIIESYPTLHLIASGGVVSIMDIEKLDSVGCKGVIIGKALYEGRIKLTDLKKYIARWR